MKRYALLFCIAAAVLTGCNNKLKNEVEVSTENNIVQDTTSSSEKVEEKKLTLEKIAEIANNGDLEIEFPDAKIKKETLKLNEGNTSTRVVWLYPKTKDEVRIDFKAEDSSTVWRVTIDNKKSKFYSKTGIKPGMSLKELNSLNNKPVDFFGFEWDFGGVVKFNEGALENKNLFVYLKTDQPYGKEFIGDLPHSSEEENVRKLDLRVGKIVYEASKIEQNL